MVDIFVVFCAILSLGDSMVALPGSATRAVQTRGSEGGIVTPAAQSGLTQQENSAERECIIKD
jgi:hypothetical protein